jgi:hypothetical protein
VASPPPRSYAATILANGTPEHAAKVAAARSSPGPGVGPAGLEPAT